MDLGEIVERDGRLQIRNGSIIDNTGMNETWRSAAIDRRELLGLLRQARRAIDSVGECHGCIYDDHDEALALLHRLTAIG